MNAEQFERLVREVDEQITGEQKQRALHEAHGALDHYHQTLQSWSAAATRKVQASQQLSNVKGILEAARAEAVQEAYLTGEINGKNADERSRAETIFLDRLGRNGSQYATALRAFQTEQVAYDQAALEESIAGEELKAAKYRCSLCQAALQALSE